MTTVCQLNECTGCMACVDICSKGAITIKDGLSAYNAEIDETKCIGCNLCHNICQNNRGIELAKPIKWYQGWAENEEVRAGGSSGGAASALMLAFVKNGGYVCSCTFKDGQFCFDVTNNRDDISKFKGSKYVKSNPQGAYKKVKELLKQGEKVLFIGLPCQVAAIKLFVGDKLQDNLYTADLICHGTPSPQLLQKFLGQYGYKLEDLKAIKFRVKGKFQVCEGYKGIITTGVTDSYLISFLKGLCYTENCYDCNYAQFNRVSDITLGDSWGSNLSVEEQKRGVSLLLCQTQKGIDLIEHCGMNLLDVDIKNAVANNKQLSAPMPKPPTRKQFFNSINKGKKYNKIIFKLYPKQSFKQQIKKILIKVKLWGGVSSYSITIKR